MRHGSIMSSLVAAIDREVSIPRKQNACLPAENSQIVRERSMDL